ncbi:MAG: tRNA (adenosine(37)-N6)-threonylcarbamoyltransferase complex transferase subunit TsaD [Candidatus Doudnabacteria bacterium]|nr:tRNA (adenosine(37)-N6)-threonylcarbamoyltransferase complex transferase subunit TsaD [Candidatus Doudnabacteria bacterium]
MKRQLNILAIETSCDETAAAVIVDGVIKSNIIASQARLHSRYGGVVPEVAAREHLPVIIPIIDRALKQARLKLSQIRAIAVTQGPGLMTSLMVGVDTAKAMGAALNIPVIPVNHLEAHIYANFAKSKVKSQKLKVFPALILIVSGGHTLLVLMKGHGQLKVVGETLDDAAGEAFDKTAKLLGLGYPGGPALSELARRGNSHAFNFPRPMINSKNLNFSFSGLKTAVLYKLKELSPINYKLSTNLAASVQQAIVDVLIAKTEQAIKQYRPKTIMLGGGVAANELLRKRFKQLAKNSNLKSLIPNLQYCTDNAAMIGLAAYYKISSHRLRITDYRSFTAEPNLELK